MRAKGTCGYSGVLARVWALIRAPRRGHRALAPIGLCVALEHIVHQNKHAIVSASVDSGPAIDIGAVTGYGPAESTSAAMSFGTPALTVNDGGREGVAQVDEQPAAAVAV